MLEKRNLQRGAYMWCGET